MAKFENSSSRCVYDIVVSDDLCTYQCDPQKKCHSAMWPIDANFSRGQMGDKRRYQKVGHMCVGARGRYRISKITAGGPSVRANADNDKLSDYDETDTPVTCRARATDSCPIDNAVG
ncbi:hypothetical protein EVAR_51880_1 [Eumeta japonica]|uniref:Uncharacterized protein n=1 Tax=Eumeta variegata TaxID=151549 RepID=A0A4C1YIK6_EUMVA|nr:hypothetical protein EVAR_51880_1 [Eumeta japonica]